MLTSDLREMAYQYVDNRISMQDLEEWLVPNLPMFLASPESDDADIVSAIELGLADVSNRTRTQAEFRQDLKNALDEHREVMLTPMIESNVTGSVNPIRVETKMFSLGISMRASLIREVA